MALSPLPSVAYPFRYGEASHCLYQHSYHKNSNLLTAISR